MGKFSTSRLHRRGTRIVKEGKLGVLDLLHNAHLDSPCSINQPYPFHIMTPVAYFYRRSALSLARAGGGPKNTRSRETVVPPKYQIRYISSSPAVYSGLVDWVTISFITVTMFSKSLVVPFLAASSALAHYTLDYPVSSTPPLGHPFVLTA